VVVDGASIWSAASVPSNVLTTVKAGTTLQVIERIGVWYRVRLPNDSTRVGFILARQVEPGGPGAGTPPPESRPAQSRPSTAARRGPPRRAFLAASGGYLPSPLQFDNTVTFTEFVEQGSRKTTYTNQRSAVVDVSYGVEIHGGLFAAGAVTRSTGSADARIDEQVPHPFQFNQMRTLTGAATDLAR